MKNNYDKIIETLKGAREIAVFCHISPDGDTIACALALYRALNPLGKTVHLFSEDDIPEKYRFLEGWELFEKADKKRYELAVAVDCSDADRMGGGKRAFLAATKRIAIDHHKSHSQFAHVTQVESDAAACAEIVCRILEQAGWVTDSVAEALFVGLVADTGCFQFSSTTAESHRIASMLMRYKIDAAQLVYLTYRRIPEKVFNLKKRVLSACRFFDDGKISLITFRRSDFDETGTTSAETDGIIDAALEVASIEVAFSVSEVSDKNFKISVRTKDYVDASDLASTFGGGGHSRAAGCRLNGFYEDIVDKLLKAARDRLL